MTDSPKITLNDIENSGANLALLGHVVTWRLMGIRVREADLTAALKYAGFKNHMPPLPTARKALRRTLQAWIAERTQQQTGRVSASAPSVSVNDEDEDDQRQRTLIRVINRPGSDHLVFGIVSEDVDMQALGLTYGTQLRILLHKKSGEIVCTTDARGIISAENESIAVATQLQPIWAQYRTLYFSEDLSRMVRSIITGMKAVSLRKEGGVYFVPASEHQQVEIMRSLLASLPTSGHEQPFLCALPVPDVQATKSQMACAVHYGFMDEVRTMAADLERFSEAKPGTVRSQTIAERIQSYKDLRDKTALYTTLLSMQQHDIVKELDALTEKARAIVLGVKPTQTPRADSTPVIQPATKTDFSNDLPPAGMAANEPDTRALPPSLHCAAVSPDTPAGTNDIPHPGIHVPSVSVYQGPMLFSLA